MNQTAQMTDNRQRRQQRWLCLGLLSNQKHDIITSCVKSDTMMSSGNAW